MFNQFRPSCCVPRIANTTEVSRKESLLSIRDIASPTFGEAPYDHHHVGHTHFWERAMLSRRQFMTAAAATTGVVLGSGLWMPGLAQAWENAPRPIPGGFTFNGKFFHVDPLSPGLTENSSIFDFHGAIGAAIIDGTGKGTNTKTGVSSSLTFDTDMRFMQGVYIGMDGEKHSGTFSFI
jgi:hypothetical protein